MKEIQYKLHNSQLITTLPAGKYFIGDPFYVMKKKLYEEIICAEVLNSIGKKNTHIEADGRHYWFTGTDHGDGNYKTMSSNSDGDDNIVDTTAATGQIGIFTAGNLADTYKDAVSVVSFQNKVNCSIDENYTFTFEDGSKKIEIKTK